MNARIDVKCTTRYRKQGEQRLMYIVQDAVYGSGSLRLAMKRDAGAVISFSDTCIRIIATNGDTRGRHITEG